MAILKTALEESILSKSEQAALRVITRVSYLSEGLKVLRMTSEMLSDCGLATKEVQTKSLEYQKYLAQQIGLSLLQHRLPASPTNET